MPNQTALERKELTMDSILSKALREFTTGPLNQLIVNLGGQDGEQWEQELKKFLRKESCWSNTPQTQTPQVPKPKPSILEFISTVKVPAATVQFVGRAKFVVDTTDDALVKISYVGGNVKEWFLNGDGKTEDPIDEQTLQYAKLRKASVDGPIIAELGGQEKSETTLSEMFSLMEKQGKGEDGVLLNNGYANIFYIKDLARVLRAVSVGWRGGGWYVISWPVVQVLLVVDESEISRGGFEGGLCAEFDSGSTSQPGASLKRSAS
jgi:hypothetical protein